MANTIEIPCFACDGRGYFDHEDKRGQCPECGGTGQLTVDEIERDGEPEDSSSPPASPSQAAEVGASAAGVPTS